jgi:hypothetical protein
MQRELTDRYEPIATAAQASAAADAEAWLGREICLRIQASPINWTLARLFGPIRTKGAVSGGFTILS